MLQRFLLRIWIPQLRYNYSPKISKNPFDSTKDLTEFPPSSSDNSDFSSDESFSDIEKNNLLSDSSDEENIIIEDINKNK